MAKRRATKKTASSNKRAKKKASQPMQANQKAQWTTYRMLQANINRAWNTLKHDINAKASTAVIRRDTNHLMLLLGECNYMVSECVRMSSKNRSR